MFAAFDLSIFAVPRHGLYAFVAVGAFSVGIGLIEGKTLLSLII